MVMQAVEEYCALNDYDVVAVVSENARPEGMSFPMKFALSVWQRWKMLTWL